MPDAATLLKEGLALHRAGRLDRAADLYQRALALDPGSADALKLLGLLTHQAGDPSAAADLLARVHAVRPGDDAARAWLGLALAAASRYAEAHPHLQAVLADPAHAEDPDLLAALGLCQRELGAAAEAAATLTRAVAAGGHDPEILNSLGAALLDAGDAGAAEAVLRRAVDSDPGLADAWLNLGAARKALAKPDEAAAAYDRALALDPDDTDALFNKALALQDMGECLAAVACLDAALAVRPGDPGLSLARVLAHLPPFFARPGEPGVWRERFDAELARLEARLDLQDPAVIDSLAETLGRNQPFYLGYQGENDRELMARYGRLAGAVQRGRHPDLAGPRPRPAAGDGRVRVAVVSGYFRNHSVWKAPLRGWVAGLDRERFAVFGCQTHPLADETTEAARAMCQGFARVASVEEAAAFIRGVDPHVLLFPEVGMDPLTARMAPLRLAPVQAASWGHPVTTGLESMDYYLSSRLMEPPDGGDHYTEELVGLPGLGAAWEPPRIDPGAEAPARLSGLPPGINYFCPQSLYKYLPACDHLFADIAARVPGSRLVFIARAGRLREAFAARIAGAFADRGLNADDHLVFLPWMSQSEFAAAARACHVFLDSPGWNGCNTAMESARTGLPVVTLPGGLMRGRHGLAVNTLLECPELVARTPEEYVTLAQRLGRDSGFRDRMAARTRQGFVNLTHGRAYLQGLQDWLASVAG